MISSDGTNLCDHGLMLNFETYVFFSRVTRTVMSAARSSHHQATAPLCQERGDMTRRNVASSDQNDEDELMLCEVYFVTLTLIGLYSCFDDNLYSSVGEQSLLEVIF